MSVDHRAAAEAMRENVAFEQYQTFGDAVAVEHRLIAGIVEGAKNAGWSVD